jgi:hypothetical protein
LGYAVDEDANADAAFRLVGEVERGAFLVRVFNVYASAVASYPYDVV